MHSTFLYLIIFYVSLFHTAKDVNPLFSNSYSSRLYQQTLIVQIIFDRFNVESNILLRCYDIFVFIAVIGRCCGRGKINQSTNEPTVYVK